MNMLKFLLLFTLIVLSDPVYTQDKESQSDAVDSLRRLYQNSTNDTIVVKALRAWDNLIYHSDPDLDYRLNLKIDSICQLRLKENLTADKRKFFQLNNTGALNNLGILERRRGNFDKSMEFHKRALAIAIEAKSMRDIGINYNNIGVIHESKGNYDEALRFYGRSLKIREKIGDKQGIASSYGNLGIIYNIMKEFSKAIKYLEKSLVIQRQIKNKKGEAFILVNIGIVYYDKTEKSDEKSDPAKMKVDMEKSLQYFTEALKIQEEIQDVYGKAITLSDIAAIYTEMGTLYDQLGDSEKREQKFDSALLYLDQSIYLRELTQDEQGKGNAWGQIGKIHYLKGNYPLAIQFLNKSMQIAEKLAATIDIRDAAEFLWKSHKNLNDHKNALRNYELFIATRDSLQSKENQKELYRQEYKYEYEKQAAKDSVKTSEEKKVKDAQIAQQNAELRAKQNQQYMLFGGLGLVFIFALLMFNRFKLTQKQKSVIEQQKHIVEEKNKEITDSINYAKRIQAAILPPNKLVKEFLPDSFILYKPKDIVAGDFYWMEKKENKLLIAACDCTGHGVPGAMVSVVCNNGLNRAVREYGLTDPGKILDKTREIVIQEFEKSEEEVKDGMDVSLVAFIDNKIKWAGANNPLWLIRNNEIIEYKPNKQPIGKYADPKPFTTHDIELQKGDSIYIFTDGFQDQFGGEKGKKFKAAKFKELLLSIQNESMEKQKELISSAFESWKGDLEQNDDVCVIGVRV